MSEELKFRPFAKTKGFIIEDGTKKGFGSLIPLGKKDQAGNKFQLKVTNPKGIPTTVLREKMLDMYKRGVINEAQKKFYDSVPAKARVGQKSVRVKNIAEGKKLAAKLSKMFRGGGAAQELPIQVQQGPELVNPKRKLYKKKEYSKGGLSTKKYANAVTIVNNLR
jgi:hypothetical protein